MKRLTIPILLLCTSTLTAQDQAELRWRWQVGAKFYIQTTSTVKQTLVIEDDAQRRRMEQYVPEETAILRGALLGSTIMSQQLAELLDKHSLHPWYEWLGADKLLTESETLEDLLPQLYSGAPQPEDALARGAFLGSGALRPDLPREIQQKYEQVTLMEYEVKRVHADGGATVVQRLVPGWNRVQAGDVQKADQVLEGIELHVDIDKAGQVTRVYMDGMFGKLEPSSRILARLAPNDPSKRQALERALSRQALTAAAQQTLGLMPGKVVARRERWQQAAEASELNLGIAGTMKVERSFQLDAIREKGAKKEATISFQGRMTDYRPARTDSRSFQVVVARWLAADSSGTIEVDLDAGRPIESNTKASLAGFVLLRNNDKSYPARFWQEHTAVVKVLRELPSE